MLGIVSSVRDEASALWQGGRGKILLAIALPWGVLVGYRMALPVLLPSLQAEFGLSLPVAGLLVTTLWFFAAIGQLPGGVLTDQYGETLLMCLSLGLVAIAFAFVIVSPNAFALFAAVAIWGLGHSLYPIARITKLSEIYPERLGSALGLTMATGDLGQTILPPVIGTVALALVWQVGFGLAIPVLLLAIVVLWVTTPKSTQNESAVDSLSKDSVSYVVAELRRPAMVFMIFILFLYIFLWQAFTSFYPTYLIVEKNLSPSMASVLFGLFFAAGAVMKPIAGMAYDRIGVRWALILVLVTPIVGLFLLPWADGLVMLVLVTLFVSTMLGNGAITQSFLADQFPADMQGTGLGAVRTIAAVLGATGPVLFGTVADWGYFDEAYIALAVLLVIVIVLSYYMPPPSRD